MKSLFFYSFVLALFSCSPLDEFKQNPTCEKIHIGKMLEEKNARNWMDSCVFFFGMNFSSPNIHPSETFRGGLGMTSAVVKDFRIRNTFFVDIDNERYFCSVSWYHDAEDIDLSYSYPGDVVFIPIDAVPEYSFIGMSTRDTYSSEDYPISIVSKEEVLSQEKMVHIFGFSADSWGRAKAIHVWGHPVLSGCIPLEREEELLSNQFWMKVEYQHSLNCMTGAPVFIDEEDGARINIGVLRGYVASSQDKYAFLKISLFTEQEQ